MKNITILIDKLKKYWENYISEENISNQFINFLNKYKEKSFVKDNVEWHITGSIIVFNKDYTKTLLMHHKKLWFWVNFWWHCDWDTNIINTSIRELEEEAWIPILENNINKNIFDISIQEIPKHWNTEKHLHYDIRYFVCIDENIKYKKQEIEVNDIKWFNINDLNKIDCTNNISDMLKKIILKKSK